MHFYSRVVAFITVPLAMTIATQFVRAELVINVEEVGANVVASGNGSINLASLFVVGQAPSAALVGRGPTIGRIHLGGTAPVTRRNYSGFSGPLNWGPVTGTVLASSGSGDAIGLTGGSAIGVPLGYVSGESLSANSVWAGANLTTLGLTPGTYKWTWGDGGTEDSLTLNIGPTNVPEPSAFMLTGLALSMLIGRRRRPLSASRMA